MSTTLNTNVSGGAASQQATRVPGPVAHGGELKQLLAQPADIPPHNRTMELNERQLCDVESLCNGSFSPIEVRSARNVANASTGRTMGRTAMQTHVVRLCIDRVS